ncbi:MAG: carboxyltransferase domain-containing protein [bacterium]
MSLQVQKKIWNLAAYFDGMDGIEEVVPGMNNMTLRVTKYSRNNQWLEQLEQAWDQSTDFSFYPEKTQDISLLWW